MLYMLKVRGTYNHIESAHKFVTNSKNIVNYREGTGL